MPKNDRFSVLFFCSFFVIELTARAAFSGDEIRSETDAHDEIKQNKYHSNVEFGSKMKGKYGIFGEV